MSSRIDQELELLRQFYPQLEYRREGHWVLLPRYPLATEDGWSQAEVAVAFQIPNELPGIAPYGFHVSPPPTLGTGATILNVTASAEPPWDGPWLKFSWAPEAWQPTTDVRTGSNMLQFVLSFAQRFKEGA